MSDGSPRSGAEGSVGRVRVAAVATCSAVLLLFASGCGDDDKNDDKGSASSSASASAGSDAGPGLTEDQAERKALVPAATADYATAAEAALAAVTDSVLVDVELDRARDGAPVWDVTVANGDGTEHDVVVEAASGTVRTDEVDPDQDAEDRDKVADRLGNVTTTWAQAAETALAKSAGAVTAVELDHDSGRLVWSVDVVSTENWNKTTYDVDVKDGRVTREHVDRD